MHAHTKTNSLVLALSQDTREGGKHNIHRYLKNDQKGVRGRNRFGCAARLSQQLPLIIKKKKNDVSPDETPRAGIF